MACSPLATTYKNGTVDQDTNLSDAPVDLTPCCDESTRTAFVLACQCKQAERVSTLLPKVDTRALHLGLMTTALSGDEACMKAILAAKGLNPNASAKDGTTALMVACRRGHEAVVLRLLDHGADPNRCTNQGNTALLYACEKGHWKCTQALLSHNADVHAKGRDGSNALMLACQYGHVMCASILLNCGIDPNATNKSGVTALMLAAKNDNLACARVLLANRADPSITTIYGITALMFAKEQHHKHIIQLLRSGQ